MLNALLDQIRRTHAGDPWYGVPRMQFLRGLPSVQASLRPAGSSHSVWELVLHMSAWADVERLRPADLERLIGDTREPALGTGVTVGAMLVGLAQHDAYHTGQLALLRQLITAGEPAGERASS